MKRLSALTMVLLAIMCIDGRGQSNIDPFLGRWYSKETYDKNLYGTFVFRQLDISKNNVVNYRAFAVAKNQDDKEVLYQVMEIKGKYDVAGSHLKCLLSEGNAKIDVTVNDANTILVSENSGEISVDTIFWRESAAPWAKRDIAQDK